MRSLLCVAVIALAGCGDSSGGEPADTASADTTVTSDSATDVASGDTTLDVTADVPESGDTAGRPCTTALDCSDVSLFVCDPATHACKPSDCSKTTPCPSGKTCISQTAGVVVGICLPSCPTIGASTGCGADETCVTDPGVLPGHCAKRGAAKLGEACVVGPLDTGCSEGICRRTSASGSAGTCIALCDPREATNPCPAGKICGATFDCSVNASSADPASFETFCATSNAPCAVEGGVQRGFCEQLYGASLAVCRRGCVVGASGACPSAFICATPAPLIAGSAAGVCMPANDGNACQDGGAGTCTECIAKETASGGCCAAEATACTSTECKQVVERMLTKCRRDKTCIASELAGAPLVANSVCRRTTRRSRGRAATSASGRRCAAATTAR
jgi:hypothetical protein